MTHPRAERFLTSQYLPSVRHRPLHAARGRDARRSIQILEELGLLDRDDAEVWRARFARLLAEAIERPAPPEELRAAARALLAHGDPHTVQRARPALEAVGALSWRDGDLRPVEAMEVDRVIPVPPQSDAELVIATVVIYRDALHVHWYDTEPSEPQRVQAEPGRGGPFALGLTDDRGTAYTGRRLGATGTRPPAAAGRTVFYPVPPRGATWLELRDREMPLVRVPL